MIGFTHLPATIILTTIRLTITHTTTAKINYTQGWAGGGGGGGGGQSGDTPTSPYGKTPEEKRLAGKNPPYMLEKKPLTSTAQ